MKQPSISPSSSSSCPDPHSQLHSRRSQHNISLLRISLLIILVIGGLGGGVCSFTLIRSYQYQLYDQEFQSLVADSYHSLSHSLEIQLQSNLKLANDFSFQCPDESDWPNCVISSIEFQERTRSLKSLSQIFQYGIFPIVTPENRETFETFALNYYETDGGYPSSTGMTPAGGGIFTFNSNFERVLCPNHTSESRYDVFLPMLQLSEATTQYMFLLSDGYSQPAMKKIIDEIFDCVTDFSQQNQFNYSSKDDLNEIQLECSALSDYIQSTSAIGTPIFSANNPTQIVGIAGALFEWSSVLKAASRIDSSYQCVIESNSSPSKLYFDVNNGVVRERNKIDYNPGMDGRFKKQLKKSFVLNAEYLQGNSVYTITYYSTRTLPNKQIAAIACFGCIGIALFISIIFEIFNFLIKREAYEANLLLDSKRTFVRFISHEIRTPLNTISLSLRLLQENLENLKDISNHSGGGRLITECLELIDDLDENSTVAVTTLNDLINYDKIETKTFRIEKKPVNLWCLVDKTVGLLSLQAKEKEVKLQIKSQLSHPLDFSQPDLDLGCLRVIGDSMKLGQVIRNLVSNALKFTPPNGLVSVSVEYEPILIQVTPPNRSIMSKSYSRFSILTGEDAVSEQPVGHILIQITDTGPGLSTEQQSAMFHEGVQFNANELQAGQGSGLGLWISREIVSLHCGKISVKSDGLGKGSTFQVLIPVFYREEAELSLVFTTRKKPTPTLHNKYSTTVSFQSEIKERHVLVVDDAASNRKLVCRILKSKGFICHEAENGLECIEEVLHGEHHYDFILLDFEMPVMDGPTAARKLREERCDIPIIGITGNVLPEDVTYFIEQGANFVLPKPLRIDDLLERVSVIGMELGV